MNNKKPIIHLEENSPVLSEGRRVQEILYKAFKEKNAIRRKSWDDDYYLIVIFAVDKTETGNNLRIFLFDSKGQRTLLSGEDNLATDWEIIKL